MGEHWKHMEEIHYNFYLMINLKKLVEPRRKSEQIFKEMEAFIKSKTSIQCRSHFLKKSKNVKKVLEEFIRDYYESRYLDVRHAIMELKYYLKRVNYTFLFEFSQRMRKRIDLEWILR
jgi:hypothetical protein